jgi:hypothetical protein
MIDHPGNSLFQKPCGKNRRENTICHEKTPSENPVGKIRRK